MSSTIFIFYSGPGCSVLSCVQLTAINILYISCSGKCISLCSIVSVLARDCLICLVSSAHLYLSLVHFIAYSYPNASVLSHICAGLECSVNQNYAYRYSESSKLFDSTILFMSICFWSACLSGYQVCVVGTCMVESRFL